VKTQRSALPAPTPEAIRGPVRRSRAREPLTAPTRVSPAPTTEYEQHDENDQYGLHGHGSSPPGVNRSMSMWRGPASESGRLCYGDGGHAWGARRRRALMLPILFSFRIDPSERRSSPKMGIR
jgi:hypothetical protein